MKYVLFALLLALSLSRSQAQQFSDKFKPVLAEAPNLLRIVQHSDGNYLIFSSVDYYQGEPSGSLFKVDGNGSRVASFKPVHTDSPIGQVLVLPSGKILAHGWFHYLNGTDVGKVILLGADGSPDGNFHVDPTLNIRSMAAQSTGKILAAIDSKKLIRLNADGSVDGTFSPITFSPGISRITVGPDDTFFVTVGSANIYRYTADGQRDMTFSAGTFSGIGPLALQSDGKLVFPIVNVLSVPPYTATYTVVRLLTSGAPDASFNAGGTPGLITDVLIRKNGKIAITGQFNSFDSQTGNIVELNSDGSFSRALFIMASQNPIWMIEDSHENIFATGSISVPGQEIAKPMIKIKPDVQLDMTFNLPVWQVSNGTLSSLGTQSSGKILFGDPSYFDGPKNTPWPLTRFLSTGDIDASFTPSITNSSRSNVTALLVQDDDKIIVSGSNLFLTSSPHLARLNADGSMDNSFQTGTGFTYLGNKSSPSYIRGKNNLLYFAGWFDKYNGQKCQSFAVLNADGSLAVTPNSQVPAGSYLQDMEIQSSGKALLLGNFSLPGGKQRNVIRVNPDGSLDNTFDLIVNGNTWDIEVDDHDNIWLVGSAFGQGAILLRFLPDGQTDNTLDQGTGFAKIPSSSPVDECIGFFVKSVENNRFVVGGSFTSYDGNAVSGVVMMDNNGNFIPVDGGNLDPGSMAYNGWFTHHSLYIMGRLSKNRGQRLESTSSIVFPLNDAPVHLSIEVKSSTAMNLTWQNQLKGADKIVVERSDVDDLHYEIIDTIDPGAVSYQATGLKESTPYYFKIYGTNEFFSSPAAEAHDTTFILEPTLLPPTDITTTSFTAHWTYPDGTDSVIFQLSIDDFKTLVPGYQGVVVKNGSISVTGLEPGTSYEYRVKRFKNGKTSGFTEPATMNIVTGVEHPTSVEADVYPNPATQGIFIKLSERETNATATFHSSQGEHLMTVPLINGTVNEIELRSLKPGVFILSISSASGSRRFKLVKA